MRPSTPPRDAAFTAAPAGLSPLVEGLRFEFWHNLDFLHHGSRSTRDSQLAD